VSGQGPKRLLGDAPRLEEAKNAAAHLLRKYPYDFTAARIAEATGQSITWVYNYMGHPDYIRRMLVRRHLSHLVTGAKTMMQVWPDYGEWPKPWFRLIHHLWGAEAGPWVALHHPAMIAASAASPGLEISAWLSVVESLGQAIVAGCGEGVRSDPLHVKAAVDSAIGIMVQAARRGDWRPNEQRRLALLASTAILTDKYSEHLSR